MKGNSRIIIFAVVGLLLIALLAYFFGKPKANRYDWAPTFRQGDVQPYDFKIFQDLMRNTYETNIFRKRKLPETLENLKEEDIEKTTYFYLGEYPYHKVKEAEALVSFVKDGGTVFMLCNHLPDSLLLTARDEIGYEEDEYDDETSINQFERARLPYVIHPSIKAEFVARYSGYKPHLFSYKQGVEDTSDYYWRYINSESQYSFNLERVGYFKLSEQGVNNQQNDANNNNNYDTYEDLEDYYTDTDYQYSRKYTNFVKLEVGEGTIYWHTNPILFTNLYLSSKTENKAGLSNLDKVLSFVENDQIIWDVASRLPDFDMPERERPPYEKPPTSMEYIFSQPPLTWAWLLLLSLALLYALFGTKRRQRHIPIVEPNRNTSLEFVKTIGRLYYQQQNHKVIFEKLMQLYLSHLRQRYSIVLRGEWDEKTIKRIILRTDVDEKIVSDIFQRYDALNQKLEDKSVEMSAETLNDFYTLLERFYQAEEARKN